MAFPFKIFQSRGGQAVEHFLAEGEPTIVFWDGDVRAAVAYRATVDGQLLSFIRVGRFSGGRFFDQETGSEWSFEGLGIAGPLEGMRLTQVADSYVSFWFAWASFVPETFLMSGLVGLDDALNAGKNSPWGDDPNHQDDGLIRPEDPPLDIWRRLRASR